MSLPCRNGKRRRSSSGSDWFSGAGDSCVSPELPSRPVLSPPPGLGRGPRAAGAGTAGPTGPRAAGAYALQPGPSWALMATGACTPRPRLGRPEGSRAMLSSTGAGLPAPGAASLLAAGVQLPVPAGGVLARHCLCRYRRSLFLFFWSLKLHRNNF